MNEIHKVGLLAIREGHILLCRKKNGTNLLILPGGKIEANESHLDCLTRELQEELSGVSVQIFNHLGTYVDAAAGNLFAWVRIELYSGELTGEPEPRSEIAELVWFGPQGDRSQLSPSLANRILPDLIARGLLSWN